MKKIYLQPNTEAIEIMIKESMLFSMSGESSEFGKGSGEQLDGGTPVVNSRSSNGIWDEEDY